jgi:uncharacterized protein YndB with AHSA1/START domain
MIAPDGTVFPNHHRYGAVIPEARLDYTLLWGENGPKHADAWASFDDIGGATKVTLGMVMATAKEYQTPRALARWSWVCRRWASWRGSSALRDQPRCGARKA